MTPADLVEWTAAVASSALIAGFVGFVLYGLWWGND